MRFIFICRHSTITPTKWQFFPPKLLVVGKFKAEDALGKFTHPHDSGFYYKITGAFEEKLFDSA